MNDVKWKNILLLIHGSELVDNSMYARAITNSGVTIDTTEKHFSQYGSLKYAGGKAYSFYTSNIINGTMDYTIDFWYLQSGTQGGSGKTAGSFWSHGGTNSSGGSIKLSNTYVRWYANGERIYSTFDIPGWKHFAMVKKNGITSIYINGTLMGSSDYNESISSSAKERFGYNDSASSQYFAGYIQELRICDVAIWDADFTPPTEPYSIPPIENVGESVSFSYSGGIQSFTISKPGLYKLEA